MSLKATVSLASYFTGFFRLLKTNTSVWLLKTVFLLLPKLSAVCHRAQYWAQFFFIIFINDIDIVCHIRTNMKFFANNAKLHSEINRLK